MGYKVICTVSLSGINDIDVTDFSSVYADVSGYATDGVTTARIYFGQRVAVAVTDMVNNQVFRDAIADTVVSYLNTNYSLGITDRDVYVA